MTSCDALVPPYTVVNNVLTNNSTLQVSNSRTSVGQVVRLSCLYNYTLDAESPVIECQTTGKWNFTKTPTCLAPVITSPLTQDQKIILGVAGGVGGVVLIILIVILALIYRTKKKARERKSGPGEVSSVGTPGPEMMGDFTENYPQQYPYVHADDYRKGYVSPSRDYRRGYANPAYPLGRNPDYLDDRREYLRDIHRDMRYGGSLPPPYEDGMTEFSHIPLDPQDPRYPLLDPHAVSRQRFNSRRFRRNGWKTRRSRRYPSASQESDFYREYFSRRPPTPEPQRPLRHGDPPRRYLKNLRITPADKSDRYRIPSADYDREYFGDLFDDPIHREPRDRRPDPVLHRDDPDDRRLPVTNAVRMYEEYGRPLKVRMLEEAYELGLKRPYQSTVEKFNYGLRAVTSRSADLYGGRGDDPTRFYRGMYM